MPLQYIEIWENDQVYPVRLMELSFGSNMSSTSLGGEELVSWMTNNPEVVREGLCQIEGVRYI